MKKEKRGLSGCLALNTPPSFKPEEGHAMACMIGGSAERPADIYLIEPAAQHPGFFFLSHLDSRWARVDYLTRPLRADGVEDWLKAEGLARPADAEWRTLRCDGVFKAGQSLLASEVQP